MCVSVAIPHTHTCWQNNHIFVFGLFFGAFWIWFCSQNNHIFVFWLFLVMFVLIYVHKQQYIWKLKKMRCFLNVWAKCSCFVITTHFMQKKQNQFSKSEIQCCTLLQCQRTENFRFVFCRVNINFRFVLRTTKMNINALKNHLKLFNWVWTLISGQHPGPFICLD